MDIDYGRHYRELYGHHWWWRARENVIWNAIQSGRLPAGDERILDVGCGDGLFFDRLTELGETEGIESSEALLDPDGPHRESIHVGPFDHRFDPGKTYSLILMLDVLEHLPDPAAALRHVERLLAPGGRLILTVPAFTALWTTHDELNRHFTRYRRSSLRPLLEQAGLRVNSERYFFHWMVPAKLAVRLIERIRRPSPTAPAIPPRWLNRALYLLSTLEERALRRLRLPVGSSLLVSARKERPHTSTAPHPGSRPTSPSGP